MELSFVIWIIVLGSGYIAFPVAKVFLTVLNKLIEWIISAIKYEINWRIFQGNTWRLPNFKKRLNLYSFYGNVMTKSVVTRMSLRSDKDAETYLLKSGSDDNEKMSCYRQFIRGFNFYKENYIHDMSFFKLL
jgi:hypothetical protein